MGLPSLDEALLTGEQEHLDPRCDAPEDCSGSSGIASTVAARRGEGFRDEEALEPAAASGGASDMCFLDPGRD